MTNFVLFNHRNQINRYKSEKDILLEWFGLRQSLYTKRKAHQLCKLKKDFEIIHNKTRFITGIVNHTIKITKNKKSLIIKELQKQGFSTKSQLDQILKDREAQKIDVASTDDESEQESDVAIQGGISQKEYDYLLSLPLWSLSEEKIAELTRQQTQKKEEYERLKKTHINQIWERDLDDFVEGLDKQNAIEEKDRLAHKGMSATSAKRRPQQQRHEDRQPYQKKPTPQQQKSAPVHAEMRPARSPNVQPQVQQQQNVQKRHQVQQQQQVQKRQQVQQQQHVQQKQQVQYQQNVQQKQQVCQPQVGQKRHQSNQSTECESPPKKRNWFGGFRGAQKQRY